MGFFGDLLNTATLGLSGAISDFVQMPGRRLEQSIANSQEFDLWKKKFNAMNEYNTPEAQVERLNDAGLNPSLAMQNIGTGSAGSSSNSGGQPSTGVMASNYAQLLTAQSQRRVSDAQAEDLAADAQLKRIEAKNRERRDLADISKALSEAGLNNEKINEILLRMTDEHNESLGRQSLNAVALETAWVEYAQEVTILNYLPYQQKAEFLVKMSEILSMQVRNETERKKQKLLVQQAIHEAAKGKGQKFENALNKKMQYFLEREIKSRSWPSNPYEMTGSVTDNLPH